MSNELKNDLDDIISAAKCLKLKLGSEIILTKEEATLVSDLLSEYELTFLVEEDQTLLETILDKVK